MIVSRALRIILFPYTTLFRSQVCDDAEVRAPRRRLPHQHQDDVLVRTRQAEVAAGGAWRVVGHNVAASVQMRSEEHTSELQSPCNLVCRLLLENKNTNQGKSR